MFYWSLDCPKLISSQEYSLIHRWVRRIYTSGNSSRIYKPIKTLTCQIQKPSTRVFYYIHYNHSFIHSFSKQDKWWGRFVEEMWSWTWKRNQDASARTSDVWSFLLPSTNGYGLFWRFWMSRLESEMDEIRKRDSRYIQSYPVHRQSSFDVPLENHRSVPWQLNHQIVPHCQPDYCYCWPTLLYS